MLKYFFLILMMSLTGCAYTSRDTYLNQVDSTEWEKTTDARSDTQLLTYQCGKEEVSVRIRQTLEADGSAYLIFFVVPVGSADLFDKEYDGIHIIYSYGKSSYDCGTKKIKLVSNGTSFQPTAVSLLDNEASTCSARWDVPMNKSGKFSIVLPRTEQCKIPPINFTYETGSKYKHDGMNP